MILDSSKQEMFYKMLADFFAKLIIIFMKQKRCDSREKMAISCMNFNVISAKTTPANTASWLLAINSSLNIIFNAKIYFNLKNMKF
jgi:hypothetical protein